MRGGLKPKRRDLKRPPIMRKRLRDEVWARDEGRCVDCRRFSSHWEADHVTPLHLGGSDTLDNTVTRCRSCHRRKSNNELRAKAKADRLAQRHAVMEERLQAKAGKNQALLQRLSDQPKESP